METEGGDYKKQEKERKGKEHETGKKEIKEKK